MDGWSDQVLSSDMKPPHFAKNKSRTDCYRRQAIIALYNRSKMLKQPVKSCSLRIELARRRVLRLYFYLPHLTATTSFNVTRPPQLVLLQRTPKLSRSIAFWVLSHSFTHHLRFPAESIFDGYDDYVGVDVVFMCCGFIFFA